MNQSMNQRDMFFKWLYYAGAVLLLGVRLLPKRLGALPGLLIAAGSAAARNARV